MRSATSFAVYPCTFLILSYLLKVVLTLIDAIPEIAYANAVSSESLSLSEGISKLPDKYKTVIECLAVKGMSVKETSDYLGISESNVRKRCERARKMLKEGGYYYGL